MRQAIQLLRVRDNQLADAELLPLTDKHLDDFERLWKARLRASSEADQYWDWVTKNRIYMSSDNFEAYAIECDQVTQGLMLIEVRFHRSQVNPNRRVVYVQSLATAPWNRPSIQTPPDYRTVESTLLRFAQHRSFELGYGGLVGLHALPEAEAFYERMGMMDCGEDPDMDDLTYFEWYRRRERSEDGL